MEEYTRQLIGFTPELPIHPMNISIKAKDGTEEHLE